MVEVLREKGTTDTELYPTGLRRMSASDGLPPRQPSQVGDATETTSSFMIAIWLPRRVTSRLKGSQFTKHRGNQFRDRGMNVHRSLHYSIWRTRVHHVQHAMNHFIAADAENRCSQDLF